MVNMDKRPPLDIAIAMDVSGSMGGDKIVNAKKSLLKLVEHIDKQDRLSLVTFDSNVSTAFGPSLMTASDKSVAQQQINKLRAGSMTNLSGGLIKALALLKEQDTVKGTVRRCLVFTDGHPTSGVCEPEDIVGIATEHRAGLGISTFGYGRDHNADLLTALALDGNFHFIDTPEKILKAFGQELGGLISTYAQNVRLTLHPGDGVEIVEVLNDVTVEMKDGVAHIEYDDLLAEQDQHIVVKLKVTKRDNAHPRGIKLVTANASYFDLNAKKDATATAAVKVKFVPEAKADTEDNRLVVEEVVLQQAVKVQTEAMALADAGNFAGAQKVLLRASRDYQAVGVKHFGDIMEGLGNTYGSAQNYESSKSSTRAVRNVMRRRRAVVGSEIDGVDLVNVGTSNAIQDHMMDAFMDKSDDKAEEPAVVPEPKKDSDSTSSGASKSRSNSRW
jgi:Ca-activated chloride channel family protein